MPFDGSGRCQAADFDKLHPSFALVRDYLARVAPPGKLTGRQHINPIDLGPRLLPFINLVDALWDDGNLRFRYRLVGSRQTEEAGREITGKFIEEAVLPEYLGRIIRNMRVVVFGKTPIYDSFPMPHPQRDFIRSERVYYPLASDGETVDMILILNGYPDNPRARVRWL
jgi:hypothetical protein